MLNKLDVWVLRAVALGGGLISIMSSLGVLDLKWAKDHMDSIALALVATSAIYASSLLTKIEKMESSLQDLRLEGDRNLIDRITSLRKQVDPDLELVFGDYISSLVTTLQSLLRDNRVPIDDLDVFRSVYKKTLTVCKGATFYATSVPRKIFFWSGPSLTIAMEQFIKSGGTIKRIFFIGDDSELSEPEVIEILHAQSDIGVEVYTVHIKDVPGRLRRHFMVDTSKRIGWETKMGPGGRIASVEVTAKGDILSVLLHEFEEIMKADSVRRFCPPRNLHPVKSVQH